jgi:pimeloyl-ACP methyl ester carboxylesterase
VPFLLTLAGSTLYQSISVRRERARFPPPGQLVDIGGRRLHLLCIGQGQPTVIFESSSFGGAGSFARAREEVSAHARVCSYDRAGMGWSDPGPAVLDAGTLTSDLERLLDRARVPPPYILVPSSIGGLTAELFARRHPEQVAGLVFVDAAERAGLERAMAGAGATGLAAATVAACLTKSAARLGILRAADPFGFRHEPHGGAGIAALYRVEPMATLCGLVRGARTSLHQLREAPPLRADVPLIVLIAESSNALLPARFPSSWTPLLAERQAVQQRFASRVADGTWRIVPGSDHLIASSQPHAVATAVVDILARARARRGR